MFTYLNTCEVCGKVFEAKRKKARFCQDKSSCRVTNARKQKQARMEAEKMTVSLEQFTIYELVGSADKDMKMALDHMLRCHGKDAFGWMLISVARMLKVSV